MEPKFNTSFIPKKPIVAEGGAVSRAPNTSNIFSTLASIVFTLTILAMGGMYIYRNILIKNITQADKDLNTARAAFETDKLQNLLDANARISAVKSLLEKHIVVSELMGLMQALTVKRMRFSVLKYDSLNGTPEVTIDGEVQTYNALAEQSDIFSKSEYIKDQKFSNFSLSDNGNIKVTFFGTLDPKLVSYKQALEALSTNQ